MLFGDQTFRQRSTEGCRRRVWAMSELSSELAVLLGQVSDVVPIVCRVASDLGVCSVCIGNFRCASPSLYCLHLGLPFWSLPFVWLFAFYSWDFIYAEYIMEAGYHHRSIVWQVIFLVFTMSDHKFPYLNRSFACMPWLTTICLSTIHILPMCTFTFSVII